MLKKSIHRLRRLHRLRHLKETLSGKVNPILTVNSLILNLRNLRNLWMLFGYLLTEHHLSSRCGTFSIGVTIRHSTKNEDGTRKARCKQRLLLTDQVGVLITLGMFDNRFLSDAF